MQILTIKTVKKAFKQLKNKILDENSLIVISVLGACLVGQTMEGIMVIALYEIGKILDLSKTTVMNIVNNFRNKSTAPSGVSA